MGKKRLDVLLFEKGLFQSREKARNSIMAGVVYVDGVREDKAGMKFDEESDIFIKENINPFVSRGGLKLEKALDFFGIDLKGKTAMDVGASTGGFTDCMLKRGAVKVFAIDVGYGQLAWKIRNDPRVVIMERTNIRYVTELENDEKTDFAAVDVSFISLVKVIGAILNLLNDEGCLVTLIKPQFEAGREKVKKSGVVRDSSVHTEVIKMVVDFFKKDGLKLLGLTYSPVKGPEGNIEYLAYFSKGNVEDAAAVDELIDTVVEESHKLL